MELFGDLDLARIIERVSAEDDAAYVQSMMKMNPDENWGTLKFDDGESCYAGNSPYSNTHGFGTNSIKHDVTMLERIEEFFRLKNCPTILSVAGVVEHNLFKMLFDKSYRVLGCRNVYIHNRVHILDKGINKAIEIKEVSSEDDLEVWLKVVSEGFAGKQLDEPDAISLGQSVKKGNRFFIGYLSGEPAAASALYINGDVARLGGMGTLVNFRGNGLQKAMVNYRTQLALDEGCSYIFSDTQPGNNSQRNLERNGYKLAYMRMIYRKL